MKLFVEVESERGKTLGKGGQDYIKILVQNEYRRKIAMLNIFYKGDTQEILMTFVPLDCNEFEVVGSKAVLLPHKTKRFAHAIAS